MDILLADDIEKIRLINRPIAVPYNYRIMYKLAQLALIMGECCRKKGCSMQKLQMLSMGLTSKREMDQLEAFVNNRLRYPLIRYDPTVNRAVLFALSEKIIVRQSNNLFRLTPKGKTFYSEIAADHQMLIVEKEEIKRISEKLTEDQIKNVMADWRTYDVQN